MTLLIEFNSSRTDIDTSETKPSPLEAEVTTDIDKLEKNLNISKTKLDPRETDAILLERIHDSEPEFKDTEIIIYASQSKKEVNHSETERVHAETETNQIESDDTKIINTIEDDANQSKKEFSGSETELIPVETENNQTES